MTKQSQHAYRNGQKAADSISIVISCDIQKEWWLGVVPWKGGSEKSPPLPNVKIGFLITTGKKLFYSYF